MRKPIMIHLFFILIALYIYLLSLKGGPTYLIWNMTLALVSYDALLVKKLLSRQGWLALPLLGVWLIFFPNTFYMLTDLVHMTWMADVLTNSNVQLLFFAFVASILFGLYCGIESWLLVREDWKLAWYLEYLLAAGLSLVSALAIYIGRFDRLNSWDVLLRPGLVVDKLLGALAAPALPFVVSFAFLQWMSLIFLTRDSKKKSR